MISNGQGAHSSDQPICDTLDRRGGTTMADDKPSVEEVADAMFKIVKEYHGKKRFKAGDLQKEMQAKYGKANCDRKLCKAAIKELMESERCIYGYAGGSWIALNEDKK